MKFKEARAKFKTIKRPAWGGYWKIVNDTILMHTKEGEVIDIRETQNVDYTLSNIEAEDWMEATEENCPLVGGKLQFSFEYARHYLKRGYKMTRWSKPKVYTSHSSLSLQDTEATDWTFLGDVYGR